MDNNKFVFNLEWYAVLLEYPAEVRFEVYEAIMRYASTGTLAEMKPLAKMAFSFIRKEMDYNRERYESTVEKRREAGRKGGSTKQMQANASDDKQTKQMQANASDDKQTKQMQGLLSINDNDNVNINELSSTTTRAREGDAAEEEPIIGKFFEDRMAVEAFCMTNRITTEELRRIADEVATEWRLTGQTHESEKEARRHLLNQVRIKIQANTHETNQNNPGNGLPGIRRGGVPAPGYGLVRPKRAGSQTAAGAMLPGTDIPD